MERLVVNKLGNLLVAQGNGQYTSPCFGCDNSGVCIIEEDKICGFYKAIEKLYAYEDAEEQGLLHIAPLKDGIPIFVPQEDFDDGWFIHTESYKYGVTEYFYGQLGKDFWTTKEEAEQALAEMGGEEK